MSLQIIELKNPIRSMRVAPRSGALESAPPSNLLLATCMCANRYGPILFSEGNAERRAVPRRNSAAFASLGR